MTNILKASPVAEVLYKKISNEVDVLKSKNKHPPTLATILVGEDPASAVYVRNKGKTCVRLGFGHKDFKLHDKISQNELLDLILKLNEDSEVDGILVQQPLPKHLNPFKVFECISPKKDVDCFSPYNVGLLVQNKCPLPACTPSGVMEILKFYNIKTEGKNALILGRSDIVGKPMSFLLLHANATVTIAHSKTKNLSDHIHAADIIIAAIGKPHVLGGDLPWRSDSVVIDVGINRRPDNSLVGDVDFESVAKKVNAITPVPGGVGPMTIAMLMQNTLTAAKIR